MEFPIYYYLIITDITIEYSRYYVYLPKLLPVTGHVGVQPVGNFQLWSTTYKPPGLQPSLSNYNRTG